MTTTWSVLRNASFRRFWVGGTVSGIGGVVQDVTAGWIMTGLTTAPLYTALLQTAASLPVCVFTLAGGALADTKDRRKLMLVLQSGMFLLAALLGVSAYLEALTAPLLLLLVAAVATGTALVTPATMRTVPDLLTGHDIPKGVTLNSLSVNVARLAGSVVAGILIAQASVGAGFFMNALSFVPLLLVLASWTGVKAAGHLPPERMMGAIFAGWRFVWHSPGLRNVLIRAGLFVLSASAVPSLLPIVARRELHLGPVLFGAFMGTFGAGALVGATLLAWFRERLSSDQLIFATTLLVAGSASAIGLSHELALVFPALLVAGAAWVISVATFGVSTGSSAPEWVLGRALSHYAVMFQGGVAIGSVAWGTLATSTTVSTALVFSTLTGMLSLVASRLWRLPESDPRRLAPAQPWPLPSHEAVGDREQSPVLVTVDYEIDAAQSDAFLNAMNGVRGERLRDGAFEWSLFVDVENPSCYREQFLVHSWLEHLRQHERVTVEDRDTLAGARAFHIGERPPVVSHFALAGGPK